MNRESLDETISVELSVQQALKVMVMYGRSNGRDSVSFYTALKAKLRMYGDVSAATDSYQDAPGIQYFDYQTAVEDAFLRRNKSEAEKELEILQQKMNDLQQQMNIVKQKLEK